MAEFNAADVGGYYDRHTDYFVNHRPGGRVGAIHRAVWAPGVTSQTAAFQYVESQILAHLRDRPNGSDPTHVVDLGCGVGASLCYLAERLPIHGTGLTLSPVPGRARGAAHQGSGTLGPRHMSRGGLLCAARRSGPGRRRVCHRVVRPRDRTRHVSSRRADGSSDVAGCSLSATTFRRRVAEPAATPRGCKVQESVAPQHAAPL